MKQLTIMLKPASSLCNLRCKYCFYADVAKQRSVKNYGMMKEETAARILHNIYQGVSSGNQLTLAFQGGEPTLAGLSFFQHIVSVVSKWDKKIHVSYALQTNGITLDDDWCRFLEKHNFLVGISYDILPNCHDNVRVQPDGTGTAKQVTRAIALMEKYGVQYNVLCTLTNQIARHPQKVWKQILQMDLKYVQFTPCLGELDSFSESVFALTPKRFESFYSQIFQYWLEALNKGQYRSIKLFDDVIHYMAFGAVHACGMNGKCHPQLVVEADGSTYPCDFYCTDHYCLGNMATDSLDTLMRSEGVQRFLERDHKQPALCETCEMRSFCNGGCKRMQKEICCAGEETFCGFGQFLQKNRHGLNSVAQYERRLAAMRSQQR